MSNEINFSNMPEFKRLADDIMLLTGKEMPIVVRNSSKDYIKAAYKQTPLSAKFKPFKAILWKGVIVAWRACKTLIRGRGMARAGWIESMRHFGFNNPWDKNLAGKSDAKGYITDKTSEDKAEIIISNQVDYILKLDQENGIGKAGMDNAKAMMENGIKKLAEKQIKMWGR